jgi:putative hemolysin
MSTIVRVVFVVMSVALWSGACAPQPPAQLANPASVNCIEAGGTLTIEQNGAGDQYGVCHFEADRQCEEWALLNGECPAGGLDVSGYVTPAAVYCAITGGEYAVTGNSGDAQAEQGTCTFSSGQTCDAAEYFNGSCAR